MYQDREPYFPVPSGSIPMETAENLYAYFQNLGKNGPINPYLFQEKWDSLENHDFSAQQISQILLKTARAIAKIQDFDFVADLKKTMLKNWDSWQDGALYPESTYKPDDLANVIRAHEILRIKPTAAFLRHWGGQVKSLASKFKASHFVTIFHAAAHLGIREPIAARKELLRRLETTGAFLRNASKSPLIWSCAALDSMSSHDDYRQIANYARQQLSKKPRSDAAAKQRYDSHLWFDWQPPNKNPGRQETKKSREEKFFQNFIQRLGFSTNSTSSPIPDLPQAIDFTAHYNGTAINIEVDGPTHNLDLADSPGETELNGATRFRSAHINKLAPDEIVLRVSTANCSIITAAPSAEKNIFKTRRTIALQFLHQAANAKSGVYQAEIGKRTDGYKPYLTNVLAPQPKYAKA